MVYQIMVQTRLLIIFGSAYLLLIAARFVTRYAVCRRQFSTIPGKKEERKLLDYQTHMTIIGPHLATALVINFAGRLIINLNEKSLRLIEKENNFKLLDVLHHFTSGMKAYATECQYIGCDELRQLCGGAGFALSSGIA